MAGWTYVQLGMPAGGRALLEKAIDLYPASPAPYGRYITALLLEGRSEEARAWMQRMLVATGEAPDVVVLAGSTAAAMGDLTMARDCLEGGLPEARDLLKAWGALSLAWVLQRSGEGERARELVEDAARRSERRWGGNPKKPEDYVDLARILATTLDIDRMRARVVREGW